jgi:hypothetical protein
MTARLLLVLTVTAVFPSDALRADAPQRIGWLSSKYEVGRGGPETVSTGKLESGADDPGGVSYGSYQLASKRGVDGSSVRAFVETYYEKDFSWFNSAEGRREWLAPGMPDFEKKWIEVVGRDGNRFLNNEHEFIYDTHYKPVVDEVRRTTGLDVEGRGDALRNAVWSTAVQHGSPLDVERGHAHKLIQDAIKAWSKEQLSVVPGTSGRGSVSDKELLNAIYDERERRNPRDAGRYKREREDALRAQSREPPRGPPPDLNKTALGQFSRKIGIVASPLRLPPKELFLERGQITFDFSGYDTPYSTTREPSVPGAYSGVRIGRGYDVARVTRTQAQGDLRAAGLSEGQIQTYAGAAGLKGEDARKYLDRFAYGPLYTEAQKAGLKGKDLSNFIADRSPNRITLEQQKALFQRAYERAEKESRDAFPDYAKFPAPARDALTDMVFDRGLDELKTTLPGFVDHVLTQDWEIAAAMSKRNGAGVERNRVTRELFEAAARSGRAPD